MNFKKVQETWNGIKNMKPLTWKNYSESHMNMSGGSYNYGGYHFPSSQI